MPQEFHLLRKFLHRPRIRQIDEAGLKLDLPARQEGFHPAPQVKRHSLRSIEISNREVEGGGPGPGAEELRQSPDVVSLAVIHGDREQSGGGATLLAALDDLR